MDVALNGSDSSRGGDRIADRRNAIAEEHEMYLPVTCGSITGEIERCFDIGSARVEFWRRGSRHGGRGEIDRPDPHRVRHRACVPRVALRRPPTSAQPGWLSHDAVMVARTPVSSTSTTRERKVAMK